MEIHHGESCGTGVMHEPFFLKLDAIHSSTYPVTEQQANRFAVMGTPYTFRDRRADI